MTRSETSGAIGGDKVVKRGSTRTKDKHVDSKVADGGRMGECKSNPKRRGPKTTRGHKEIGDVKET